MSNDEYGFGGGAGYSTNVSFGDQPSPAADTVAQPVKDISTQEFMSEVIEASSKQPVLVDFWAPWCGPCKQLAPALEAAVAATRGKVKLVKMDIDKYPDVAGQMGIQSIPAVVAFVNGRPADMFMGAKPEGEIRDFITKIAGADSQDEQVEALLEQARALVEQGDVAQAGNIYGHILSADPKNLTALSEVGHLYLKENNLVGAKGVVAHLDDKEKGDAKIASLISAIELAEQAESLGDHGELLAKVEANPDDPQARLDLALALNVSGKREEAADELLEIMRRKPGWNDDAAKTQLLQFFEAWGLTDEVTVSARRRLSSLLFS